MGNKYNKIKDPNAATLYEDDDKWPDMPEFYQYNKESFHRIVVRFDTEEDVKEFGEKIDQPHLSLKNKYTTYPLKADSNLEEFFEVYEDEKKTLDN